MDVAFPETKEGGMLSPYEASTGVILPMWSTESKEDGDKHHPFFLKHMYTSGSTNRALRHSRLQVEDEFVHDELHEHVEYTQKPPTEEDAYRIVLLNVAKYIPRYALDMDQDRPTVFAMSNKQINALRTPGVMVLPKHPPLREELADYIMGHPITLSMRRRNRLMLEELTDTFTGDEMDFNPYASSRAYQLGKNVINIAVNSTQKHKAPSNKAKIDLSIPRAYIEPALVA